MVLGPAAAATAQTVEFDIPAQPLASALDAYSAATARVAVYNGNLALGRLSSAVKGRLTPEVALTVLLRGSGLAARYTNSNAFVLLAGAPEDVRSPGAIAQAALSQQTIGERRYSGIVQRSVIGALCASPGTRPGLYRAVLTFWIGPSGHLERLRLLGSTGDEQRDVAIAASGRQVIVDEPPPAGMAQPFTMVVLPRSSGGTIDCPPPSEGDRQHG